MSSTTEMGKVINLREENIGLLEGLKKTWKKKKEKSAVMTSFRV